MKPQNKSLYTRRFNKLKKELIEYYRNPGSVEFSDTAVLRWGPECCIVAHDGSLGFTISFFNEETDSWDYVEIVKTPYCALTGLIGIHVNETDLHHITDMINDALKDGFERIYVRSVGTVDSIKRGAT